jgi:hypothetical protein
MTLIKEGESRVVNRAVRVTSNVPNNRPTIVSARGEAFVVEVEAQRRAPFMLWSCSRRP